MTVRADSRPRRAALALGALLIACAPALAHPDITMECRVLFNFENGQVTGVGEAWVFDETFSAQLIADYDENRDGAFDAAESGAMEREVFGNLAQIHYYTFLSVGGEERAVLPPFGFSATQADGLVTFAFGIRLPEPLDPAAQALSVELKDPDFAVYAALAESEPVLLRGDRDKRCRADIRDDTEHPYFDGTVIPREIRLRCD